MRSGEFLGLVCTEKQKQLQGVGDRSLLLQGVELRNFWYKRCYTEGGIEEFVIIHP